MHGCTTSSAVVYGLCVSTALGVTQRGLAVLPVSVNLVLNMVLHALASWELQVICIPSLPPPPHPLCNPCVKARLTILAVAGADAEEVSALMAVSSPMCAHGPSA